jgi:isopentenyldiphosphate isomerase
MGATTLLDIVDLVDSCPYTDVSEYYQLIAHDGSTPLGYVTEEIALLFKRHNEFDVNNSTKTIILNSDFDTLEKRDRLFEIVAESWKEIPELDELLVKGWRNELYTVYNPHHVAYMHIERSFSVLIGVVTYGVHINGYIPANNSKNGQLKMWIPRRSATKPTFPGMLDNTVAGGLGYPHGIWDTLVKECYEEAGLAQEFVESHAKACGVLQYMYKTDDNRIQPEVEYIYDIAFDNEDDIKPHPVDGEAEDFQLMEVDEILTRLYQNEFKPNCGLVIIDFLIRHGIVTPESEKYYTEILTRSHRRFPFPLM